MYKYFLAGLYSVSLLLLLCTSGCQVAGGGGMFYGPPSNIVCDRPWVINIEFCVWPVDLKEKYGKLNERYKNVTIHIRNSINSDFIAIPMAIESVTPATGEVQFIVNMKAIPCDPTIEHVEYYVDYMFDNHYNRSKYYIVPVSKN